MKRFSFFNLFTAAVVSLSAQNFYAGLGCGYGLPVAQSVLGTTTEFNFTSSRQEIIPGSYARGFNFGIYGGYSLKSGFSFECSANYLLGEKINFSDNYQLDTALFDRTKDAVSARSLRITPTARITIGIGKLRPYLCGGLAFGLMNKLTDEYTEHFETLTNADETKKTIVLSKGIGVGFAGALGATWWLSDHLSAYGELNNFYMSWAPEKGKITAWTYNGEDQLPDKTVSEKEVDFVDVLKSTSTTTTDPNQPAGRLKNYLPMSSWGLNIGIHYTF